MSLRSQTKRRFNRLRGYALIDGIKLPLKNVPLAPRVEKALAQRGYEMQEAAAAGALVNSEDVVLELGSGLGFLSAWVAKKCHPKAVICIEANPDLVSVIQQTHRANSIQTSRVINAVLDAAPEGETKPFYRREEFWSSSLDKHAEPYKDVTMVDVLALDACIGEHAPTVMLIDIEGGELALLEGAKDLGPVRAVAVEFHQNVYGQAGVARIFQSLLNLGFAPDMALTRDAVAVFIRQDR